MVKESRTGVYICQAGTGAADSVDLQAVAKYAEKLPSVVLVNIVGNAPKLDPVALAEQIRKEKLDRIVVAADSPGYFKPAFTRGLALAGGDPEKVVLASFVGNGAGGSGSTERAQAVVNCAVHGVPKGRRQPPRTRPSIRTPLSSEAGSAAYRSPSNAGAGKQVHLVEKSGTIGGKWHVIDKTFPTSKRRGNPDTENGLVGQDKNITLGLCRGPRA
jgi:heterodisulfide reductase subunit A-like polyferredoxin